MGVEHDLASILNPFEKLYSRLTNFISHHENLMIEKEEFIAEVKKEIAQHSTDILRAKEVQDLIKKLTTKE